MSLFNRILVFAEHKDPQGLAEVVELAKRQGAELSVCDVVQMIPSHLGKDAMTHSLETAALQHAYASLREFCASSMDSVNAGFTVLTGNPYLAVMQQVHQTQCDLLVHLRDPARVEATDTTFAHFVRKCPCPVWGLPAGDAGDSPELVVALDRGPTDLTSFSNDIAANCLQVARSFLPEEGGRMNIVHAWKPYGLDWLRDPATPMGESDFREYLDQQRRDYQDWFDAAIREVGAKLPPSVSLSAQLFEGGLLQALRQVETRRRTTRLVLGSVGAQHRPGLLVGGSAEAVLADGDRELIVVKPRAFVSPLRFDESAEEGSERG